jgi:hypothetical protein
MIGGFELTRLFMCLMSISGLRIYQRISRFGALVDAGFDFGLKRGPDLPPLP